jgi:hypothetical protein
MLDTDNLLAEIVKLNEINDRKALELDRKILELRRRDQHRSTDPSCGSQEGPATPAQHAALRNLGIGGRLEALTSIQADRLLAELNADEFAAFETEDAIE